MLDAFDDILTVEEVCEILKIGKNNVYTLLRTGTLSALRIGHVWRVPKSALKVYVEEKSCKTK